MYYVITKSGKKFEFAFMSLWAAKVKAMDFGGYVVDKNGNKV